MDPFSLCYSDDNKKNTFNNGGNNGHGLKNFTCKTTLTCLYNREVVLYYSSKGIIIVSLKI